MRQSRCSEISDCLSGGFSPGEGHVRALISAWSRLQQPSNWRKIVERRSTLTSELRARSYSETRMMRFLRLTSLAEAVRRL